MARAIPTRIQARALAALPLAFILVAAVALPAAELDIDVAGLRSGKGKLLICLTRDRRHFPDCSGDPAAIKLSVAASAPVAHVAGLPAGDYALSLVHDENGNGRLDTRLGIPSEGIAFSRNPRLMFGPPSFARVRFPVGTGTTDQSLKVKYFL